MRPKYFEKNDIESRKSKSTKHNEESNLTMYGSLFGSSQVMLKLYEQIERVAKTEATTLIVGESGTGKELIARTIHDRSERRDGPFIAVNCGAIPDSLIEAELFGHEKGSFTGAAQSRCGYFEHASNGTLFLDEVIEMSPALQVKLLRVLETNKFFRVGGSNEIISNVRVIAATNRDLDIAVKDNLLRQDLMYRLAVFPLRAPSLRERGRDLELLAQHFLDELNTDNKVTKLFSKDTLEMFYKHKWPGNVREMKNTIYRSFILSEDIINLHNSVLNQSEYVPSRGIDRSKAVDICVGTPLVEAHREIILATLKHYDNDRIRTAKALGISLKTLCNRLHDYR